jgi:uncharacterized protein (DUF2062 family)
MTDGAAMRPAVASSGTATTFWQRRIVQPLRRQLTQGMSPDRLALTVGVGAACSLFPFLGFTSLLNLGIGLALRLNQPVLQTLNQLLGPVQLALILVYVRLGETLWGATATRFTLTEMIQVFREASLLQFLERFGWAGLHAFSAWLLTAPLLVAAVAVAVRPALRRLSRTGNS